MTENETLEKLFELIEKELIYSLAYDEMKTEIDPNGIKMETILESLENTFINFLEKHSDVCIEYINHKKGKK